MCSRISVRGCVHLLIFHNFGPPIYDTIWVSKKWNLWAEFEQRSIKNMENCYLQYNSETNARANCQKETDVLTLSDLFNNFKSELETATLYLDCIWLMIQSHSYFPPERPSYTLHMLNKTNLEPTQVKDAYATHLLLISHYALFQFTATRSSLFAFLSGLGHKHFCQQLFLGYQRIWQIHRLQCDWQRVGWPNFYQV